MTMIRSRVSPVIAALLAICVPLGHCIADEANTTASVEKHHEGPKAVPWNRLAPENGKPFNDPFSKLASDQLADVSYVARIRRLLAEEKIEADGVDSQEAERIAQKLKAQDIDVGWLMLQRNRVKQIRGLQVDAVAKSVAESLKSEVVTVKGFATPLPDETGKVTAFLVTPTMAMCRHSSAPSPLQVVHVDSLHEHAPKTPGTPVVVKGTLIADTKTTPFLTAEGMQVYRSAYRIVPTTTEILVQRKQPRSKQAPQ
jgi:hypothetical protein